MSNLGSCLPNPLSKDLRLSPNPLMGADADVELNDAPNPPDGGNAGAVDDLSHALLAASSAFI